MTESKLNRTVCAIINTRFERGHASSVESPETSPGIPDVNYCVNGIGGEIELKVGSDTKQPELRPSQYKWFRNRLRAGGNPFFLCLNNSTGDVYFVHGEHYTTLAGKQDIWKWEECAWKKAKTGDSLLRELTVTLDGGGYHGQSV